MTVARVMRPSVAQWNMDRVSTGITRCFKEIHRISGRPLSRLSMFHWATLGRITRATVIGQRNKEYIIAARARGVNERKLLWKHALRAILSPSLTAMALSAASVVTSIFVVEIIFGLTGISRVIVIAMSTSPDAPAALGFAVYSVLMVISLMFILDVVQALLDPRVRDEVFKA